VTLTSPLLKNQSLKDGIHEGHSKIKII